jgi:hypothetical protein
MSNSGLLLEMDTQVLFAEGTKAGRLRYACYRKLLEHQRDGALPTNGRFIFYELEQDGAIPKHYLKADGSKRARPRGGPCSHQLLGRTTGAAGHL